MTNLTRMDAVLSAEEVAARLGVSSHSVRSWVRSGRLPALRLGPGPLARIRVEESALERFVRRVPEGASPGE